ncbi:DUF4383 domain-containing protein [Cryptosporangium arvum]|uniref:DUF4383 domain-containing protein n=1 Tax=Cryptosporangium arvum TaxID=80871 RepID=UPI0004B17149|nr:DUF4383 domain-containing protein [Cryptosporangium arvum]
MSGLPKDHKLGKVYRYGGGLTGTALLTFGALGFVNKLDFFSTSGKEIAGLSSNGALSLISVVVGVCLLGCAVIGGNTASWANSVFGWAFILSGLVNLTIMRTDLNFLAFRMTNVIFSFVVGTALITFGMYGRVSGALPPDNPYWRERHGLPPEVQEGEDLEMEALLGGATDGDRGADPHNMAGIATRIEPGSPAPLLSGGPILGGAPKQQ